MTDAVVVLCTVPDAETADRLAELLVAGRLAACVNIVPAVRSVYRWEDRVESATEHLLVAKTMRASFESVRSALVDAHPYEVPEVVVLPVEGGHAPYLRWLADGVDRAESDSA